MQNHQLYSICLTKRPGSQVVVKKNNMELYKDHIIKEEIVIGPEQLINTASTSCTSSEILELPENPKLKCTLCIADRKAARGAKRCIVCRANFQCVHSLHKHVTRYHGPCKCKVCKITFKTRLELCRHLCPDYIKMRQQTPIKQEHALDLIVKSELDQVLENIDTHNATTSAIEVLEDNDCDFEFIIKSEGQDPPVILKSYKRKVNNHKVPKDTDINNHNTIETPVPIDNLNSFFAENESKIKEELLEYIDFNATSENSTNISKEKKPKIETVTIDDSDAEGDNLKSTDLLNMVNNKINQDVNEDTDVTTVLEDIASGEIYIGKNDFCRTDPDETKYHHILIDTDKDATETHNIHTEIDSVTIPDSDDDSDSIDSETEFDMIRIIHEEEKTRNELIEISKRRIISEINKLPRVYACPVCTKAFPSILKMQNHKEKHARKRCYTVEKPKLQVIEKCKYCNILLSKTDLHYHMLFYHKQTEHVVNLEDDLTASNCMDKRTTDFQCLTCTKIFSDKHLLRDHISQEHETNKVQYEPNVTKESYIEFKDF